MITRTRILPINFREEARRLREGQRLRTRNLRNNNKKRMFKSNVKNLLENKSRKDERNIMRIKFRENRKEIRLMRKYLMKNSKGQITF